jgi:hypothetical protein
MAEAPAPPVYHSQGSAAGMVNNQVDAAQRNSPALRNREFWNTPWQWPLHLKQQNREHQ